MVPGQGQTRQLAAERLPRPRAAPAPRHCPMSPVHPAVARRLFYRHRRRITAAAALLAANAGFVNAVALTAAARPVSHHTGSLARLTGDLAAGRQEDALPVLLLLGAFFGGAAAAGAIVGTRYLLPRRRYGVVLVLEGGLLATSAATLGARPLAGLALAAAACGLQNGMANTFYGVVVRTTHISGLLTDLAVLTGQWLRRRPVEGWRAGFQGGVIAGFAAGGVLGTLAARRAGPLALDVPAAVCVLGAGAYLGWMHATRRRRDRAHPATRDDSMPDARE